MHITNYKFEIVADKAEKAVDIFSNFFVAPLFTSSGTGREVQAVDSENSKNLTADGRRRLQILKELANPDHYYSKFSTGNANTLPTNDLDKLDWVREALLAFHRKHYRPDKMTVCIAGPQSIETLEEWIVSRYSQIPKKPFPANGQTMTPIEKLIEDSAKDAPPYSFYESAPPYNPAFKPSLQKSWPVLLTTKPLRSMRKLVMMWPIPSDRKIPDQAPSSMLSHLLGHEGVGSAFAVLQNHGMLSSLSAGPRIKAPDFTLFQVDMSLTGKGETHWKEVVSTIFAYCRLLQKEVADKKDKNSSDLKSIWGETSDLDRMFFHQTSPGGTYDYTPSIADRVVSYGTEACLSAGNMLKENEETFPLLEFTDFANRLTPEKCIIERCSEQAYEEMVRQKQFAEGFGLKKEKWYGVEYYLSSIDDEAILAWNGKGAVADSSIAFKELALPRPNRYIPRTLELCSDLPEDARQGQRIEKPIDPPKLLVDEKKWKLYHRLDDRYALPQSSLYLLIRNVATQNLQTEGTWIFDSRTTLLSSLLAGIFNEAMAQETYDADLAGLNWSLSIGGSGIKLNCFGFSDRLPDLALKVLNDFLSGEFLDETFFESSRDRVVRGLRTYFESRRADSHAMYYRDALLASQDLGIDESLDIALAVNFDDIVKQYRRILENSQFSVDCLFSGNVSKDNAKQFFSAAKEKILETRDALVTHYENQHFEDVLYPAPTIERQLTPGQDIELHFSSKNSEEENGAVLCTYQSSIPSFRGEGLSHPLGLTSSSAIRLICHMLREPLFDELRTKQQLGYIVNSYYEIGFSSQTNENGQMPSTTPIDFVSINVLSRKMSPLDIKNRIDDFLHFFRKQLVEMPESEIRDHAEALAIKLLKPIQKLQTESSNQYARIQRYGPEIYLQNHQPGESDTTTDNGLPWDTVEALASTIRNLSRDDLLKTWDRMTHPSTRSRIVSCVYGTTFPLKNDNLTSYSNPILSKTLPLLPSFLKFGRSNTGKRIVNNFSDILKYRAALPKYGPSGSIMEVSTHNTNTSPFTMLRTVWPQQYYNRGIYMAGFGLFGVAAVGIAVSTICSTKPTRRVNNK